MGIYKPGRPNKYWPETHTGNYPPELPGEYRIRNIMGVITYVGETNNLRRRMYQHLRNGKLANGMNAGGSFEWQVADGRSVSDTRREHERKKIAQHNPAYNKSKGGEGRPAKKKSKK
ncbi:MAG: GIY-YIG nuclease family protein [Lachnospiraceae bacterium]|nr:GIY-YIG nuclease family protein [Lachnospiraceae bacterium]